MDNEHTLWNSTHRDIHPVGATMQEIRDKFFEYGGKVKTVDPNALLLAPEEWGWTGYFYSGFDAQWASVNGWNPAQTPLEQTSDGAWTVTLPLQPGRYEYQFVVDGDRWIGDPAHAKLPVEGLLAKSYAATRRRAASSNSFSMAPRPDRSSCATSRSSSSFSFFDSASS